MLPRSSIARTLRGPTRMTALAICAALALALVACGGAGSSSGRSSGGGSPGGGSPGGAISEGPGTGMTVRPCLGSYTGGYNAALTLTNFSGDITGDAHVGDTVEIHLDGHHKWTYSYVMPSGALTAQTTQGLLDGTDVSCVWIFRAREAGASTVAFTGSALCDPTQACPQYALLQTFTIHIS